MSEGGREGGREGAREGGSEGDSKGRSEGGSEGLREGKGAYNYSVIELSVKLGTVACIVPPLSPSLPLFSLLFTLFKSPHF